MGRCTDIRSCNTGHGNTDSLLAIALDGSRPYPAPDTHTCGRSRHKFSVSLWGFESFWLVGEEGHYKVPGEFLPALAEMFSCDTTLACASHKHIGCKYWRLWSCSGKMPLLVSLYLMLWAQDLVMNSCLKLTTWRSVVHSAWIPRAVPSCSSGYRTGKTAWHDAMTEASWAQYPNELHEGIHFPAPAEQSGPFYCVTNDLLQVRAEDTWRVCVSWCLTLSAYVLTNVAMNTAR